MIAIGKTAAWQQPIWILLGGHTMFSTSAVVRHVPDISPDEESG